ncbi:DinB family protein [Chryseolinea lacunae]|uniref:DinB family protein n=1 Tax=Chryseolinea lacunae TaxID=2801331 RepID=A0ABS1KPF3_9BACT|nr:DinB family protein [Chryseolinea lacunae]MBL0741203.1 DinB family protein [Chryseolinea lacunae]
MKRELLILLDTTTHDLLHVLASFTPQQFNTVPFEGSWTPGQVAEHVYKSEAGIPKLWSGRVIPTLRKPDEKADTLKSIFLDYTIKMESPEFILPSNTPKDKDTLINQLRTNRFAIRHLAETIDLTLTFPDFPFPTFGELTGIEWATFVVCHAKRHTRQLQNLHRVLNGATHLQQQ